MDLVLIKKDSKEWNYIWNWLAEHPLNEDIEEPQVALNDGYMWEYMGSFKHNDNVITQFRHRHHIKTNRLEELMLSHKDFDIDSIEKSFKL